MNHDHENCDHGDLPEEIRTLLDEIVDMGEQTYSVSLALKELTLLGMGLDGLLDAIPKKMRGAEPEQVAMLSAVLTDAMTLRNRLETVMRAEAGPTLERLAHRIAGGEG